ncbi:hypothetical protein BD770DRAFT_454234, partial [Pilaira anomala]
MLYRNQEFWRDLQTFDLSTLPCSQWCLPVLTNSVGQILVCHTHHTGPLDVFSNPITYPGSENFNYKELSALSPIKIMTQIIRNRSAGNTYCGHFQLNGSLWATANREFAHVLYGGVLGLPFFPNTGANIDTDKVRSAFIHLAGLNNFLRVYQTQEVAEAFTQAQNHQANIHQPDEDQGNTYWPSYLLPADDVFPSASTIDLLNLSIETDVNNLDIQFKKHGLFSILFLYLYTEGQGHYDLS